MRLFLIFFTLVFTVNFTYSQDYFINEEFSKGEVKYSIPFEPDWNKDFFIEAELSASAAEYNGTHNVGILFSIDKENTSFYSLYYSNHYTPNTYENDLFYFAGRNVETYANDKIWQKTTLINHDKFNRLQVYKVGNEAFFAINDQVVYHVPDIQVKGNLFKITADKYLSCNYIKAHYLDATLKESLRKNLVEQLQIYNETGIHHKIAKDYQKVFTLKEQDYEKIHKIYLSGSRYLPEFNIIEIGDYNGRLQMYDAKTGKKLTENELANYEKKVKYYNENDLKKLRQTLQIDEDFSVIKVLNDNTLLLVKNDIIYEYNKTTRKEKKLFKVKNFSFYKLYFSENNEFMVCDNQIFSLKTSEEIVYMDKKEYNNFKILSIFDTKIIIEEEHTRSKRFVIDFLSKEIKPLERASIAKYKGKYEFTLVGREFNVYNMSTGQYEVKNLQVLTTERPNVHFDYHPETNEVFFYQDFYHTQSYFFFSNKDKLINTTAYLVNTKTNEITPYLFFRSNENYKQEEEARKAASMKKDIEVDNFVSKFKTFGNYYELDYDNLDYIDLTGNELLKKNNIGGTIYGIGKFCRGIGADVLIVRVRADQYSVELLTVMSRMTGISVSTKVLGVTQNVDGYTTELTTVKITRNSTDKTKYTMQVNDNGKIKNFDLTSNCN